MSPALIVQCFAVTNDQPLIHTLKFGDVINDDGIYKTPGTFLIVDMSRIIAIAQHTQPQRFVHEIVILESGFEHISRRTGSRNRVSLISQQRLEQFPTKLKLQLELVNDAALDEIIAEILFGSLAQRLQCGNVILIWPFAVWCGWVCQVVTVLRSSLPQVR